MVTGAAVAPTALPGRRTSGCGSPAYPLVVPSRCEKGLRIRAISSSRVTGFSNPLSAGKVIDQAEIARAISAILMDRRCR